MGGWLFHIGSREAAGNCADPRTGRHEHPLSQIAAVRDQNADRNVVLLTRVSGFQAQAISPVRQFSPSGMTHAPSPPAHRSDRGAGAARARASGAAGTPAGVGRTSPPRCEAEAMARRGSDDRRRGVGPAPMAATRAQNASLTESGSAASSEACCATTNVSTNDEPREASAL